jgi:toxin-antitoxin system PIN domain toxin
VILPDVNLLLYATIDAFPHHTRARQWWEQAVNSGEQIGLADPTIFGFLRVGTNPRLLRPPLSIEEAAGYVETWLAQPNIDRAVGGSQYLALAMGLLRAVGTAGNLTTDVQLAALALELDADVYSNDPDFGRFQGIRWVNPLAAR